MIYYFLIFLLVYNPYKGTTYEIILFFCLSWISICHAQDGAIYYIPFESLFLLLCIPFSFNMLVSKLSITDLFSPSGNLTCFYRPISLLVYFYVSNISICNNALSNISICNNALSGFERMLLEVLAISDRLLMIPFSLVGT